MKNKIQKTISLISILSLGFISSVPAFAEKYVFGQNSTTPDSLKVTFYEIGLTNSDLSNVFSVFKNSSGIEVDISKESSINDLISNVNPSPGTFTHIYGVTGNTYKMKGSSNGCYTKSISVNMSDAAFNAGSSTEDGVVYCTNCAFDGWSAATSNSNQFGEAIITEQAFGVGSDGENDQNTDGFGPATPLTSINVGGNEVSSVSLYLTNSSSPYSYLPEGTLLANSPSSSTRDRSLYLGTLSSPVVVKEESKGIVQIYFDYSNGLAFDDDCDAIKFNSGFFDMSVITE